MMISLVVSVVAAILAAGAGWWLGRRLAGGGGPRSDARIEPRITRLRAEAQAAAQQSRRNAEIAAREVALVAEREASDEFQAHAASMAQAVDRSQELSLALAEQERVLADREQTLARRNEAIRAVEQATKAVLAEARDVDSGFRKELEHVADERADAVLERLVEAWIEEARDAAAARLRTMDQSAGDPEHARVAKRIMGISIQRYEGHYLTERLLSNIPVPPEVAERVAGPAQRNFQAIEEVSGIKLALAETGDSIRLEGLDGVGREVARRALARLMKGTAGGAAEDPVAFVRGVRQNLEREIVDLGRRAFAELRIPRSHPEIVELVGRLNYRTSYTQNQWKHAVEAAFLCGMMASELGLDVKLARRAALMHDIGKALTHEIEGSHAVIGADYARRLGEPEVVANAIGAHHAEEPANSVYALLVAAGDAMSGARPGARREQSDNYVGKLSDLERIARRFRGVDQAFPVHGGREVRVYVREGEVTDEGAVALSTEIAKKISDEMTFPGQIKVTVVREVRAVEVAS